MVLYCGVKGLSLLNFGDFESWRHGEPWREEKKTLDSMRQQRYYVRKKERNHQQLFHPSLLISHFFVTKITNPITHNQTFPNPIINH